MNNNNWVSIKECYPEMKERVKVKGDSFEGEDIFLGTTWHYRNGKEITHWKFLNDVEPPPIFHTQQDIDNLDNWVN